MDLLENPFFILGASPGDNRQRIINLAEEKSLLTNSVVCAQARSDLTNPRKRLSAELAWLMGIGPRRALDFISMLEDSPSKLRHINVNMPFISHTNLIAAGLLRLDSNYTSNIVADWILNLAWTFENINPEDVLNLINEERIVSGFPEVHDLALIEAGLSDRRQYFRKIIKLALDRLPTIELIKTVNKIVESATDNGDKHGPILVDDMIDSYEVEAQTFFEKEIEFIEKLTIQTKHAADSKQPDSVLNDFTSQIIQVVKNWDMIAQPIQISYQSRGLKHDASHKVAGLVRELAIHLFNEHERLALSQQLTSLLQEVFSEVDEVAERASEDSRVLEDIAKQRNRLLEEAEEWRQEISYEVEIGLLIKNKLKISPEGIMWKGRVWPLDSINRISWGGTNHSINGIPTGTTYRISFGNQQGGANIEIRRKEVYIQIIERLWKAVGVRILTELLEDLREGKRIQIGPAIVHDSGIELEKFNLFSSNEKVFCRWAEVEIWNGPGTFCINKKGDDKISVALSYQEDDNVHVLEAAIRALWKRFDEKMSSLLGR